MTHPVTKARSTPGEGRTNDVSAQRRVLSVKVEDVVPKIQVRKEFRDIDSLADSILVEGQQTPIIVSPPDAQGKYVIQKGERRWRACKHASISHIDIIINHRQQSELDETAGELIENIQRDNLTALEIAFALQKFIDQDWKQVDIAKRLGKSSKFVSSHLGLLKLPDCVMNIYQKGLCGDTDTLNILRQLYELDADKCRKLCREAFDRGIYRQRARDVLNETYAILDNAERNRQCTFVSPYQPSQGSLPPDNWRPITDHAVSIKVKLMRGPNSPSTGVLLTDYVCPDGRWARVRLDLPSSARQLESGSNNPDDTVKVMVNNLRIIAVVPDTSQGQS